MSRILPYSLLLLSLASSAVAGSISIPTDGSIFNIYEENHGFPSVRSVGQVFNVPAPAEENVLTSFSFFIGFADVGVDYRFYIYEWDSADLRPTGSALFASSPLTHLDAPSFFGLNLALVPATQYVAFITTQGVVNNFSDGIGPYLNQSSPYPGGSFVLHLSDNSYGNIGNGDWTSVEWIEDPSLDFQFEATFASAVPEPSTFALVGLVVSGLSLRRLRR